MKIRLYIVSITFFSVLLLQSNYLHAGLPSIDFNNKGWKLDNGIRIENSTLIIDGNLQANRKARLEIPIEALKKSQTYLIGEIKAKNIKCGEKHFFAPKFSIYYKNNPKLRLKKIVPKMNIPNWAPLNLLVEISPDKKMQKAVVIEIALQGCSGIFMVKNLRFSFTPSQSKLFFPFEVPEKLNTILNIDTKKHKKFNNNLLGLNSQFMGTVQDSTGFHSKEIENIIKKIRPPLLRFPGGTVANWYNWETDTFSPPTDNRQKKQFLKNMRKMSKKGKKFGFKDYVRLSKENSIVSILVFNILQNSPEKEAARLRNRKAQGLKIPWIELGNENYFKEQQSDKVHSVKTYINASKKMIASLKKIDPTIKYAVNIKNFDKKWTIPLSKEVYYDAVVMHPYVKLTSLSFYPDFTTIQTAFTAYAEVSRRIDMYKKIFGKRSLLLSEWGVLAEKVNQRLNVRLLHNHISVMGTADAFFAILENEERGPVEMASLHILYGQGMGLYGKTRSGSLVKCGYAILYNMMIKAFLESELFSAKSISPEIYAGVPGIIARASRDKNGIIKIFAVNKYPQKAELNVSIDGEKYNNPYNQTIYTKEKIGEPTAYELNHDPTVLIKGENRIMLPPYSVNLIALPTKPLSGI